MAECQNGPESNLPCTMIEEQAESCNPPAPGDDIKSEVLDLEGIPDREKKSVHKKHQNGIVTTLMRASEDADNGESADSGHGSSCHDCECSADMPVNMESNMENDMSQLSLTDNRLADPGSGCGDAPGASQQLGSEDDHGIKYDVYESEEQMPDIIRLITKDLSEPYSIYTYRYFIHNWPNLCLLAKDGDVYVGAIVCKLERHKKMAVRGYIAMLAIDAKYRRRKIGSTLVTKAIQAMIASPIGCDEVVLETEITNMGALRLYENLGFIRDKRLFRYYLNGVDALRLKLWLR